MYSANLNLSSEHETFSLGQLLGKHAAPGDIICLIGDLGAGKTVLTQGIGSGLGLPPEATVNSPTYTIVAERPGGRLSLYHFDLYRIKSPQDLLDIGAEDYFDGDGVCVVEWADLALDALGDDLLQMHIEFTSSEDSRALSIKSSGPRSLRLLQAVADGKMHL